MISRLQITLLLALSQAKTFWASNVPDIQISTACAAMSHNKNMRFEARLIKREEIEGDNFGTQASLIKTGLAACGRPVDQNKPGACLWSGNNAEAVPVPDQLPGWYYNYENKKLNCDKLLKIYGNGKKNPIPDVPVVDFCTIPKPRVKYAEGCSTIYVTQTTFEALGGQKGAETVTISSWKFDEKNPPK